MIRSSPSPLHFHFFLFCNFHLTQRHEIFLLDFMLTLNLIDGMLSFIDNYLGRLESDESQSASLGRAVIARPNVLKLPWACHRLNIFLDEIHNVKFMLSSNHVCKCQSLGPDCRKEYATKNATITGNTIWGGWQRRTLYIYMVLMYISGIFSRLG